MKLPNFLFKKVKIHNTSLGENCAFPPQEDYPFDYKILKIRHQEVVSKIKEFDDIESLEESYLISLLNKLITECKEKEKPIKSNLETLCINIVSDTFRIPSETINLNVKMVDRIEPINKFQLTPPTSKERAFKFDDLNDFHNAEKAVLKRRLINSIIQGASYEYSTKSIEHIDEITSINADLKPLYERIIAINDFLLFTKEEAITDEKTHQGSYVEVILGRSGEKTEINAQGIIFPFLLNETFRGLFELFASHGLPNDDEKANYVLTHSDYLIAEPWDLRFGVTLWQIISEDVYGYESMPYFFMTLCEMEVDEFNSNLQEVFAETKKGKQFIIDLNEYALKEAEYDYDIDRLPLSDENNDMITDSYISTDDLDLYFIGDDNGYSHVITEDSLNESSFESWFGNSVLVDDNGKPMKMYHGTNKTFDEFSKEFIGSNGSYEGYGFNFTPFQGRASSYNNEKVIEAYLRAEKPMTSKTYKITPSKLAKIIAELDKGKPYTDTIVAAYEPTRYNEKWDAMYYRRALPIAAKMIYQYNKENGYGDAGLYAEICINGNGDKYEVIDLFERLGYDSVIMYDNDDRINTVIVFEPNQIKLVSNKTFNNDSNLMGESKIIKEGLYDNFDIRDADIIYYNHYQEDWGDEEEPDIQDLYNILIYDMDGNTIYENDGLLLYELDDILGENISSMIYNNESEPNTNPQLNKYYPYRLNYINSHEFGDVNETAKQLFKNQLTEYYPKLHGYIMQDGTCIDLGEDDHNTITKIPQINDKWEFVELGNIRCLKDSFDLIQEPTREQKYALRKLIANSNDLTIDIYSKDSDYVLTSARYIGNLNPSYILGQIDRFFDEGINLIGNDSYDEDYYMYESSNNKKIYVNENQLKLITESQESKSISQAKKLLINKLNYNEQEADEFVRVKLRNDLPVLRTPEGGKFILGVTRMFIDGELSSANDIGNLNSTLKLVASDAHINEYDRNLNGMSAIDLINRFAKAMSDNLNAEKEEINQMVFDTPSDYEIVRIDSFEQASQYGKYTSWCVTHDENMFKSYTSNGINQFYFCLKHGFEYVENIKGENCPLDEYGLSMIAISVNENGMLNTCTCRWNHDNGGNDTIMSTKEISQVIGMNFFNVFKPNNIWRDLVNDAISRLNAGEPIDKVFDDCNDFYEGLAVVELKGRCNFINYNNDILSPNQWFDDCDSFYNGFGIVQLNDKYNFINQEGKILSPNQWFEWCGDFENGFAKVKIKFKYNFISQDGKILSPNQWFDDCDDFYDGFAKVELNDGYNFISQEGKILSPNQWFDDCDSFYNGFAKVVLDKKRYYINNEGQIICEVNENTNKQKKIYINESQLSLLTESQESKSISAAKKLLIQRLGYNEQEADEFIRIKLRGDIPILRTPQGGKFILGATRMFIDGDLIDARTINSLNSTLKLVSSNAHINEYDRNLNGMSANDLINRFSKSMEENFEAEKNELNSIEFNNNSDYKIVRIDSFNEANKYSQYTEWCITHDDYMFDTYTSNGLNQFYFCLKNGFENIEPITSNNTPLDEYGLSMIAVSVDENGRLNTCTCRWNHSNGGNDSIMNAKEISEIINMNFYNVFKPNNLFNETLEKKLNNIKNGANPLYEFEFCTEVDRYGFREIGLMGRCNYLTQDNEILCKEQWFDYCLSFDNNLGVVELKSKFNYVNLDGEIVNPNMWYDGIMRFIGDLSKVNLDGKVNFVNKKGELISPIWFDTTNGVFNQTNVITVYKNDLGYNFLRKDGSLVSPNQWFSFATNMKTGIASISLNGKENYITIEGNLLSPNKWFDKCFEFVAGIGIIKDNKKYNAINAFSELVFNEWFDNVEDLYEELEW